MTKLLVEVPEQALIGPDVRVEASHVYEAVKEALSEALVPSQWPDECDHAGHEICARIGEHVFGLAAAIEKVEV